MLDLDALPALILLFILLITMNIKQENFKKFFAKEAIGGTTSINDLREKEFSDEVLTEEEGRALLNFDRFRLSELNKLKEDSQFHSRYRELQVMSNLADYRLFLDDKFSSL